MVTVRNIKVGLEKYMLQKSIHYIKLGSIQGPVNFHYRENLHPKISSILKYLCILNR